VFGRKARKGRRVAGKREKTVADKSKLPNRVKELMKGNTSIKIQRRQQGKKLNENNQGRK